MSKRPSLFPFRRPRPSFLRRRHPGRQRSRDTANVISLECLEGRKLLAFTPSFNPVSGVLTFEGTSAASDTLQIVMESPSTGPTFSLWATGVTGGGIANFSSVSKIIVSEADTGAIVDADEVRIIGADGSSFETNGTTIVYAGLLEIVTTGIEDFRLDSGATRGAVSLNGPGPAGTLSVVNADVVTISASSPLRVGDLSIAANEIDLQGEVSAVVVNDVTKGTITFDVQSNLDVDFAVSASTAASGAVTIRSKTGVFQSAPITGNSLVIANTVSGSVLLADAANAFASVQIINSAAGGSVEYADIDSVTVGTGGAGITGAGGVSVASGGVLTLAHGILAGQSDVVLVANNGINQTAGVTGIVAGTLSVLNGGAGGGLGSSSISLVSTTNDIDVLAARNFVPNGDISFSNVSGFGVGIGEDAAGDPMAGVAATGGGAINLTTTAGGLAVGQQVKSATGAVALTSKTGMTQSATGIVTARSLALTNTFSGAVALGDTANDIDFLTGSNTGADGSLVFVNADAFAIGQAGLGASETSGSISLTAESGEIIQVGAVTTRSLAISAESVVLDLAANKVGFLSASTTEGLEFVEANGFTVGSAGIIAAGQEVSLTVAAGNILQDPAVSGAITAGTLRLGVNGGATATSLTSAVNDVDGITVDLAAGGSVVFVDANELKVALLDGTTVGIDAAGATITLKAGGTISQTGSVTASGLVLESGGDIDLEVEGNDIATLSAITTADGDVSYRGMRAAGFAIAGQGIQTGAGAVSLISTGAITQSARIAAGSLTVSNTATAGSITLDLATNAIDGTFIATSLASGGGITLRNSGAIDVGLITALGNVALTSQGDVLQSGAIATTGTLDVRNLSENSGSITLENLGNSIPSFTARNANVDPDTSPAVSLVNASDLLIGAGGISAVASAVTIKVTGSLSQTTGIIAARSLDVTNESLMRGSISLGGSNDVDLFSASNAFANGSVTFFDTDSVTIGAAGIQADGNSVTVTVGGDLIQSSALSGSIVAKRFVGATTGVGNLALGSVYNNAEELSLTIAGVGGTASWSEDDALVILGISAAGNDVTLSAAGSVTQVGAILADVFRFESTGGATTLAAANNVLSLEADVSAGGDFSFTQAAGALVIGSGGIDAGSNAVTLAFTGGLTQQGAVSAAALNLVHTGAGTAVIDLSDATNDVDALTASIASQGGLLTFYDSDDLDIGVLALSTVGLAIAGNAVALVTGDVVTQSGAIQASDVTISSEADVTLDSFANQIAGNVSADVTGNILLANGRAISIGTDGVVADGSSITLRATGNISQLGEIRSQSLDVGNVDRSAGQISLLNPLNDVEFFRAENLAGGSGGVGDVAFRDVNGLEIAIAPTVVYGSLSITVAGDLTQDVDGAVFADSLIVTNLDRRSGDLRLDNADNDVGSFAASNANVNLADPGDVEFRDASDVDISAAGVTAALGAVRLIASGSIGQAGTIRAKTLYAENESIDAGSIALSNVANAVDFFAAKNAYAKGQITFADADGFTISGDDGIDALGNTVSLSGAGDILQVADAVAGIVAESLVVVNRSTVIGDIVLDNDANTVEFIAGSNDAPSGSFTYSGSGKLVVGVAGNGIATTDGEIRLASVDNEMAIGGDIFAGTADVSLEAETGISQTAINWIGGNALTVTVRGTGSVVLGVETNATTTFSANVADGEVLYTDMDSLSLGNVNVSGDVVIGVAGDLDQISGTDVVAVGLSITNRDNAAGSIDLSNATNDLDAVAVTNSFPGGSIDVVDADGFEVTGIAATGNTVSITINADPLSTDSLTQDGAKASAIVAGNLFISNTSGSAGSIALDNPRNSVSAVAAISIAAGADLTYFDADDVAVGLTVDGEVIGADTNGGNISLTSVAGTLTLTADVSAGNAAVSLSAATGITQSGGAIDADLLSVTLTDEGAATLTQAGNTVAAFSANAATGDSSIEYVNSTSLDLESSVVAGDMTVTVSGDLTQSDAIRVTDLLTLTNASLTSGSITLDDAANQVASLTATNLASDGDPLTTVEGNVTFVNSGDLLVAAPGIQAAESISITVTGDLTQESSAAIFSRLLTVSNQSTARGSITLDAGGNDVDDFGATNAATLGDIVFFDADDLAIAAGGITGEVDGRIELVVFGDLIQRVDSGALVGGFLSVANEAANDGDILLTSADNDIVTLAAVNTFAGGKVSFTDGSDLAVDSITAGGRVTLTAGGDVSQPSTATGVITALELVVAVSGVEADVLLAAAGNNVQYFAAANTAPSGAITYHGDANFVVGVSEGAGFLGVSTDNGPIELVSESGSIGVAADIDAGTSDVTLYAATGVLQTAGTISGTKLSLENSVSGDVILTDTNIDELTGLISVVGSVFQFTDSDNLQIGAEGFVSLGEVYLTVTGDLTQSGTITASLLDVTNNDTLVGDIALTLANKVEAFSAFNQADGAAVSFTNSGSFSIGPIGVATTGDATTTLVSELGSISGLGVIATDSLVLEAETGISVLTQTRLLDAAVVGTGDLYVSEADGDVADGLTVVDLSTADGAVTLEVESGNLVIDGDITAVSGSTSAENAVLLDVRAGSISGDGLVTAGLVEVSVALSAALNTDVSSLQGIVGTTLTVVEQSALEIAAGGLVAGERVAIQTGSGVGELGHVTQVGEIVTAELVVFNESTVESTEASPNGILLASPLNNVDHFSAVIMAAGGAVEYADADSVTIGVDDFGIETNDGDITIVAGSVVVIDPLVYGTGSLWLEPTAGDVIFRVSSDLDAGDRTLRTAIGYALANVAPTAEFVPSVVDFAANVTVISLTDALPDISKPIAFDGGEEQRVELTAAGGLLDAGSALRFVTGSVGSEVRALSITGFAGGSGIELSGIGALVANTWLGVTRDGEVSGNKFGVTVAGATALSNFIGGDDQADRNVIVGNTDVGIRVLNEAADTVIRGNFIGIDSEGVAEGNGAGVLIQNAFRTVIDGGNVISGNSGHGISLSDAEDTSIAGNFIGVNAANDDAEAGTSAVANAGAGIFVTGAGSAGSVIGGLDELDRNIVSGNTEQGIRLEEGATGISVVGNWIGLAADGLTAIANALGVSLSGAAGNVIGAGNVISGNDGAGIELLDSSNDNIVEQVFVGTDSTGDNELANGGSGIVIGGSSRNVIGSGSVISGNLEYGIHVEDGSEENEIGGAYIGLNLTGLDAIGNGLGGILIEGASTRNTLIGGSDPNVVSGNAGVGIEINGAEGTLLEANYVGLNAAGDAAVANAGHGIFVNQAPGTLIQNANVVSGNEGDGIRVVGVDSEGTVILGAYVGTDAFGGVAIGNADSGINVIDSVGIVVGGLADEERNVVSGNGAYGILIGGGDAAGASNVQISGNRIGIDVDGGFALGNKLGGIALMGAESLAGTIDNNIISGNLGHGILIAGGAGENAIFANLIGTDGAGALVVGNIGDGIRVVGGSGNTIGSTSLADGNLVSGNAGAGIRITGASGESEGNNEIAFNIIGLDLLGSVNVGNGDDGIAIVDSPNNVVVSNVVSGNSASGISISGSAAENVEIRRNLVGTNIGGTKAVGNGFAGIEILGAVNTLVGGSAVSDGNVVSGNSGTGILVDAANATEISNNTVGLSSSRLGRLGNAGHGIVVSGGAVATEILNGNRIAYNGTAASSLGHGILVEDGAESTIIGSLISVTGGNLVYGNLLDGIHITGEGTTATTVAANFIGTNQNRVLGLGNGGAGVAIEGSFGHVIGANLPSSKSAPNLGNVILGNRDGVLIAESVAASLEEGNAVFGNTIQSNARYGIVISASENHTLGGERSEAANSIMLNGDDGILIADESTGIVVTGNYVGTNSALAGKLGNKGDGIEIRGSIGNTIGGSGQFGNAVYTNAAGIRIVNAVALDIDSGNVISGNTIQANRTAGIHLEESSFQTIGAAGVANTIVGNAADGIIIAAGSTDNLVQSNLIGVTATGTVVANLGDGIEINGGTANAVVGNTVRGNLSAGVRLVGAAENVVGGSEVGDANTITGNKSHGLVLEVGAATNTIAGNTVSANGLHGVAIIAGEGNLLDGNTVIQNAGSGMYVASTSADNVISGNKIGTDGSANTKLGNRAHGVFIDRATATTVDDNTISRNLQNGVFIYGAQPLSADSGNAVVGNTIQANRAAGIRLDATTNSLVDGNVIGGLASKGLGNVTGIELLGRSADNTVSGNRVEGSARGGIVVTAGLRNTIGGVEEGAGNEVVSNTGDGISIGGVSSGNVIAGNFVGSLADGLGRRGNTVNGINLGSSIDNTVIANTVLDNRAAGVSIVKSLPTTIGAGNRVLGNVVQRNATGVSVSASRLQTIGSVADGEGNLISGSLGVGVSIAGNSSGVVVEGNEVYGNARGGMLVTASTGTTIHANFIGTDVDGTTGLGNKGAGVSFVSTVSRSAAESNVLTGNRIAGNTGAGVSIASNSQFVTVGTPDAGNEIVLNGAAGVLVGTGSRLNTVAGNFIGTDADGSADLGNVGDGVSISASFTNTVGGNVIAGNRGAGVRIAGSVASTAALGNVVSGNEITANRSSGVVVASGGNHRILDNQIFANLSRGVSVETASVRSQKLGAVIAGNTVTENTSDGIYVTGGGVNTISGNYVGTDAGGTEGLGNQGHGIRLVSSVGNAVGSLTGDSGNTVSANFGDGIRLEGASTANFIAGNAIFANEANGIGLSGKGVTDNIVGVQATGVRPVGFGNVINANLGAAVVVDAGIRNQIFANQMFDNIDGSIVLFRGGNASQPTPELTSASIVTVSGRPTLRVTGTVRGVARQRIILEFFSTSGDQVGLPIGRGSVIIGTNGIGTFTIDMTTDVMAGDSISATATTASGSIGNTSRVSEEIIIE